MNSAPTCSFGTSCRDSSLKVFLLTTSTIGIPVPDLRINALGYYQGSREGGGGSGETLAGLLLVLARALTVNGTRSVGCTSHCTADSREFLAVSRVLWFEAVSLGPGSVGEGSVDVCDVKMQCGKQFDPQGKEAPAWFVN